MKDYKALISDIIQREKNIEKGYARLWMEKVQSTKYICLWGLGSHGKNWYDYLQSLKVEVDYVYDSSESGRKQWTRGGEVLSSLRELTALKDDITVVITVRDYPSILSKIQSLGIRNVYVATVNLFCFAADYKYAGNCVLLDNMQENVLKLLDICGDDASREICLTTLQKYFAEDQYDIPYVNCNSKLNTFIIHNDSQLAYTLSKKLSKSSSGV